MKRTHVAILLIVVAGFLAYLNAFSGEFILDDDYLIKDKLVQESDSRRSKI